MYSADERAKLVVIDCRNLDTLGQELVNINKTCLRPYAIIFPVVSDKQRIIKVEKEKAVAVISRVEEEYFSQMRNIKVYNDPLHDFIPTIAKLLQNTNTVFLDFSLVDVERDRLPAGKYIELRKALKKVSFVPNRSVSATRPDDYRKEWYTEMVSSPMIAKIQKYLLKKREAYFVTDGRKATLIKLNDKINLNPRKLGWTQRVKNELHGEGNPTLLLDYHPYYDIDVLPAGIFCQLEKAEVNCNNSANLLTETQALSEPELESHIAAARKWIRTRDELLSWLETTFGNGLTEKKVEKKLFCLLQEDKEYRYQMFSPFQALIAAGKNATNPHHSTTNARIVPGNILLVDYFFRIGPSSWREKTGRNNDTAWVDGTFLVYFGEPPRKLKEDFKIVRKAILAGVKIAKQKGAQITFKEIAVKVNTVIRKYLRENYKKFVKHHVGHSLGTGLHGFHGKGLPVKEDFDVRVPPGYLLTIEPGIYRFGTRMEINLAITRRGAIQTVPLQKKLYIISA